MKLVNDLLQRLLAGNIVLQILVGMIVGVLFALIFPAAGQAVGLLGDLFVSALKAVAPPLVFVLVASSLANKQRNATSHMSGVLLLYLIGTFSAALVGVGASFLFPTTLQLVPAALNESAPSNILEVLRTLLFQIVDNPVRALANGNYMGILAWAVALGVALHHASDNTRQVVADGATALSRIVHLVIRCAPFGVFGLVAYSVATTGFSALASYGQLLVVLIGAMLLVALLINPLIVFAVTRSNPYPLVWTCLRESGVTAFFTRSSAANIPVNLELARKLELDENTYSVSIPLGATINMAGAAITISVLTLAATHTLGIPVDLPTALLLCVVSSLAACGTSGVAGGSLLLIPMACSLFGISNDVAMQVVAIGFIISVLQDSAETALNSSTDVLFTAAVCRAKQRR